MDDYDDSGNRNPILETINEAEPNQNRYAANQCNCSQSGPGVGIPTLDGFGPYMGSNHTSIDDSHGGEAYHNWWTTDVGFNVGLFAGDALFEEHIKPEFQTSFMENLIPITYGSKRSTLTVAAEDKDKQINISAKFPKPEDFYEEGSWQSEVFKKITNNYVWVNKISYPFKISNIKKAENKDQIYLSLVNIDRKWYPYQFSYSEHNRKVIYL